MTSGISAVQKNEPSNLNKKKSSLWPPHMDEFSVETVHFEVNELKGVEFKGRPAEANFFKL